MKKIYCLWKTILQKQNHFESLRGIAALVVVNEHLLKLFFAITFSDAAMRSTNFMFWEEISFPPFNLLHNGAWAVSLFFVLSGYVLSISFFRNNTKQGVNLVGKTIARYIRLAIPVFVSLVLAYILIASGAMYFNDILPMTQTKEIYLYSEEISIWATFTQGFGTALFSNDFKNNPPLWTMSVEMYGSLLIFVLHLICHMFNRLKEAWIWRAGLYVICLALAFQTLYSAFILGMILCDIKNNEKADKFLKENSRQWVIVSIGIGVFLCGYMIRGLYSNLYQAITFGEFHPYYEYLYNIWGAFFLLLGIDYSQKIKGILNTKCLVWLGRISFPLYLIHYSLMCSFTAYLYLNAPFYTHSDKVVFSVALSIPVYFIGAIIFDKLVNQPTVKLSRKIKRYFSEKSLINQQNTKPSEVATVVS